LKNKQIKKDLPILSIITVVRNCEETIEKTILSVINQNYQNIEYIIIDGMSNDNTLNIINKYRKHLTHFVSEPDKGIYDAMNKGIKLATGDWVNFMNAGDYFFDNSTTSLVVSEIGKQNFDIIYGDFIAINQNFGSNLLVKAKPLNKIYQGNLYSHQSCFIKSEVIKANLFDLKYKITADYNQMVSLYLQKKIFFYLPIPFSVMLADGISYSNINTYKEQIKIVHFYKPFSKYLFWYLPLIFLTFVRMILGSRLTTFMRRLKWKYFEVFK